MSASMTPNTGRRSNPFRNSKSKPIITQRFGQEEPAMKEQTRIMTPSCKPIVVVMLAVLLLTLVAPVTKAQQTAQITGVITDASGAVVVGAKVTVGNERTGIKTATLTSESGNYNVLFLPPGKYGISVQREGFRPINRTGIELQVAQVVQVNFQLEVGSAAETITVTATAPLLDASTNVIGGVVTSDKIENLPIKGRNSSAFMLLQPGVRMPRATMNQPVLESHFQFFSINGGLPQQNQFFL